MCRWSGQLGPKRREGDRQAPEGFYAITASQMNPNSSFYLSFNMGYPNTYDRSFGRTGSHLMVHGACSSRGCYSMTDEQIAEIYALVREAHSGGQKAVQMQALPFRMTSQNLTKFRLDPNLPFWKNLKEGTDYFEVTKAEPPVGVCGGRYVFGSQSEGSCNLKPEPEVATLIAAKQRQDALEVASLSAKIPAVKVVYSDGGQHPSFRATAFAYADSGRDSVREVGVPAASASRVAEVSRPEALESGPTVIALDLSGKPKGSVKAADFDSASILAAARIAAGQGPASATPVVAVASAAAPAAVAVSPSGARQPQASTVVAKQDQPAVRAEETQAVASKPFYQRLMSFNPFGPSGATPAAAQPQATSVPEAAPTPPARPARVSVKPQQSGRDRTAELDDLMFGPRSGATLPSGVMAFVPASR
jgi:hypothetical protein